MRRAILAVALATPLAGCGHGVTLSVAQTNALASRARLAEVECQRRCNAGDDDRCGAADDACLNLARGVLGAVR